jgi:outer membrane protein assembly factor BamB
VHRFEVGSAIYTSPAVTGDSVFINGIGGTFYALDASDAAEKWRFEMGAPAYASPAVARDVVYTLSETGGWLYGLDAESGRELWRIVTGYQGDWRSSNPVPVDGGILIGSNQDGLLYITGTVDDAG